MIYIWAASRKHMMLFSRSVLHPYVSPVAMVFFLDGQPIFSVKQIIEYEETTPGIYKATIRFEKGETDA